MLHSGVTALAFSVSWMAGQLIAAASVPALTAFFSFWTSERLTAAATVATAVTAIAVTVMTYKTVRDNSAVLAEMKLAREEQRKPLILLDCVNEHGLSIRVSNHGGPAACVRFSFDPELINSRGADIGRAPLFGLPTGMFLPGHREIVPFDEAGRFFDVEYYLTGRRTRFIATISARDPSNGQPLPETIQVLDFAPLAPVWGDRHRIHRALLANPIDSFQPSGETAPLSAGQASEVEERTNRMLAENQRLKEHATTDPVSLPELESFLRLRGWHAIDGQFQRIAIKKDGPHQGAIVVASGWNPDIATRILAAQALELDRQNGQA